MKNQFERSCNAFVAEHLGVPAVKNIDDNLVSILKNWVSSEQKIQIDFPNQTVQIIEDIVKNFGGRK